MRGAGRSPSVHDRIGYEREVSDYAPIASSTPSTTRARNDGVVYSVSQSLRRKRALPWDRHAARIVARGTSQPASISNLDQRLQAASQHRPRRSTSRVSAAPADAGAAKFWRVQYDRTSPFRDWRNDRLEVCGRITDARKNGTRASASTRRDSLFPPEGTITRRRRQSGQQQAHAARSSVGHQRRDGALGRPASRKAPCTQASWMHAGAETVEARQGSPHCRISGTARRRRPRHSGAFENHGDSSRAAPARVQ